MGMATFTKNENILNEEFSELETLYNHHKKQHPDFSILSMGMSGDYKLAIKNGSTMIRVGSSIFGARNYLT